MSLLNFLFSPRTGGIEGLLEELSYKLLPTEYIGFNPGAYVEALVKSVEDFEDRVVVDVGDGTGVVASFADENGARHVYVVGAHDEPDDSPFERITAIKGKMEEIELPEKADILVSRAMGTLVVHHKGLKDYVIARDRFLKPNGKMFPSLGRIHMAPITDERLFNGDADMPVVEAYNPKMLVASEISHIIDFNAIKEEDVYNINIPLKFTASVGATIHGLAWWFDVFYGSTIQLWLPTSHGPHTGNWQQYRCILSKPLHVKPGQEITGRLRLVAQRGRNYTIYLTMSAEQDGHLQTSSVKLLDLNGVYYAVPIPKANTVDEATDYLVKTKDVPTMQGRNGSLQQPSDM